MCAQIKEFCIKHFVSVALSNDNSRREVVNLTFC